VTSLVETPGGRGTDDYIYIYFLIPTLHPLRHSFTSRFVLSMPSIILSLSSLSRLNKVHCRSPGLAPSPVGSAGSALVARQIPLPCVPSSCLVFSFLIGGVAAWLRLDHHEPFRSHCQLLPIKSSYEIWLSGQGSSPSLPMLAPRSIPFCFAITSTLLGHSNDSFSKTSFFKRECTV